MTWICHASTLALRRGIFPNDESLDERGRSSCSAVAGSIPSADRVWIAPELRARQTAEALGLVGAEAPALRDCDSGRWSGRSLAQIEAEEPSALHQWLSDSAASPHGGESFAEVVTRVGAWFESHDGDSGHSIAVTHPAVVRAAILHAIQARAESFGRIDVGPLSRAVFVRGNGNWRFRALSAFES